jgi:ankyrin repeat protein
MLGALIALVLAAAPASEGAALLDAIKSGDTAAARQAIERHADANAHDPDGTTALIWAVERGDGDLVRRLLRAGAKPGASNDYGATPMSQAALTGNAAIIGLLLEAGADPESPNADGQTALMLVARTGNVDAAKLLLAHGARVDAREQWHEQTPLMWAAAQAQPAMMRELIAHGADVNSRARVNDWKRQVTAEPRALHRPVGGLTPLLFAARNGCLDCARVLIDAKADLERADPEGITPLILAIVNAHYDLAAFLIDRGADVDKWDLFGRTPLYVAVDLNTTPHGGRPDGPSLDRMTSLQLIERLLDAGANPNTQLKLLPPFRSVIDDRAMDTPLTIGATPLLRAAKGLDAPAIGLLLKHHANVDLPNARGMTPLMVAAGLGSTDADSRGVYTTGDVQQRAIASLTLLLAAGANVNAKDGGRGLTALHEAARWGWNDVVRFLVEHGADVHATDIRGMTPVDSALGRAGGNSRFGQRIDVFPETAALLRSYGASEGKPTPVGAR